MTRTEYSLRDIWDNIKHTNIQIIGIPEERKEGYEKIFEEIIVEISPSFIWTSVFVVCSFIYVVFLSFHYFFKLVLEISFARASRLNSFFLLVSAFLSLVQRFVQALYRVWFELSFCCCLFVFPLMGKAEWSGNPVCWWFGLHFYCVCCLDEVSCTGCYWWLGDAGSCIQVVSFVWVLTIWYSLRLFFRRRHWQPTLVLLPGKSHGWRSLVGCSP